MKLDAYRLRDDLDWPLRPATRQRDWMDDFTLRWPYRCLPMLMANQAGWELCCPVDVRATWHGDAGADSLHVEFAEHPALWSTAIGSHFGGGILTFSIPYLFRTEEPLGLMVRGPCNFWIDGAAPLDGWVETWNLEAPFTMNWKLTATDRVVRFRKGEPICLIQPFELRHLESAQPRLRPIAAAPALAQRFEQWREARLSFEARRQAPTSQLGYQRGHDSAGLPYAGHRTSVEVPGFEPPSDES